MLLYKAIFEKGNDCIGVSFPALDGCFSMGDDIKSAYLNAEEALGIYLSELELDGINFPKDIEDSEIELAKDEMLVLISCNLDEYRIKKAVKKTLTIPHWLNVKAEKESINYSKLLQEALKEHLHISE